MRHLFLIALSALIFTACGGKTPSCSDKKVVAKVTRLAKQGITDALRRNDPDVNLKSIMSRIGVSVTDIAQTEYVASIDKHSCSANLRVTLPPELAALNEYRAFQTLALGKQKLDVEGNDIVTPITFTSYLSGKDGSLIVSSEGDNVPARYIKGAYSVGAFDADLRSVPDPHAGLTLYTTTEKSVLLEPAENGALKFHINHQSHLCRSWTQMITEERGDTLVYNNPEVGCAVYFSRLGQILLVEHEGCGKDTKACYPDGIYIKQ
jgi:hypothetical protein